MRKYEYIKLITEKINQLDNWFICYENFFKDEKFIDYFDLDKFNEENIIDEKILFKPTLSIKIIKLYIEYGKKYSLYKNYFNSMKSKLEEQNDLLADKKIASFLTDCGKVENKILDNSQMNSIVREYKNQLVIAGAGSGKTTTILGKVKYLLNVCNVKPEEILILSFTKDSSLEVKERIKRETNKDITTYTFHKLGLEIIKKSMNKNVDVYDKNLSEFVKEKLKELLKDSEYVDKFIHFLVNVRFQTKDEFEFNTLDEYNEYLKDNPLKTLKGDTVKSFGELQIANYLYINGIDYEYEASYKFDTSTIDYRQYYPDFYLPKYGIYIEYFGIDENGEVAPYITSKSDKSPSEEYNEGIYWKRKTHQLNKTIMIETFYYENKSGILLKKLEKELIKYNVKFNRKTQEEILTEINDNNNKLISEISNTFSTIINLIKSNNYTIDEITDIIKHNPNEYSNMFILNLILPIYNSYNKFLNENNMIDFNDMINLASECINENKFVHNYNYVIVDEYQDISKSRYNLLLSLRNQKDYKLFCVGDDWQSIYRFTGSDIGLITKFEEYWGYTYLTKIEKTYRFKSGLAAITSEFITKNPNQIRKKVISDLDNTFPLDMIETVRENYAINILEEKLLYVEKNSKIFLIGRYKFDIQILDNNDNFKCIYDSNNGYYKVIYMKRKDLNIIFLTAHKSKGLEADYVVILNNKDIGMGFPSKISDLSIINLLLEKSDNYPYSEERRLFYVAMTRARKEVIFLTLKNNKSCFIKELENKYCYKIKEKVYECPKCGGRLIPKNGVNGEFTSCTNYPRCKYTRNKYK